MHFPSFEAEGAPPVVQPYTQFYVAHEARYREHLKSNGRLLEASKLVGQACVGIATGRADSDMQLFVASTWVGDTLSEINEPNSYEQQLQASAVMLKHTIQLLQARHDPQEVRAERQAMHFAVAAQLAENIGPANDLYRQAMHKKLKTHPDEWQKLQLHRATLSELTTTGLTSRYAGLEHLMVPALLHHDTSARGAINYDNLLVHMPPDAEPDYYRLQNKAGCIGACKRQAGKPGRLEKARSVYVPDIRLIAGHCDLGFLVGQQQRDNFPLASMLVEEAFGDPSSHTIETLDEASDRLLHTIMTDDSRRGTHGKC